MAEKGIIYYTDNRLKGPIYERCQTTLLASGLPITSCSLKPIPFGKNIVLNGQRSYPTMVRQIIVALENSEAENVFFCEHDVFYHKSHFEFTPPKDDVFYYDENVWRWWYRFDFAIQHDRLWSLSMLCANRKFALDHYRKRWEFVLEKGMDEFRSREPRQGRVWGYEPGTKSRKRGGFSDDKAEFYCADFPSIDVRHHKCFSSPKINLSDFKHLPTNWREIGIYDIPGWPKEIFTL